MYCVDERSCRAGSATTRFKYSANDSILRLRVKSSRTAVPNPTRRSLTVSCGVSAIPLGPYQLLRGDLNRDGLFLRETRAAGLVADRELEAAVDRVAPALA